MDKQLVEKQMRALVAKLQAGEKTKRVWTINDLECDEDDYSHNTITVYVGTPLVEKAFFNLHTLVCTGTKC